MILRLVSSSCALLLVISGLMAAQGDSTRVDTLTSEASAQQSGFSMTKSPTAAVLWGLIPGGGQVYTEQYWKAPLFAVPIGTFLGFGIFYDRECRRFDDQLATIDPSDEPSRRTAIANRESARDNRDVMYAISGGIWVLSLIDAYVGAHLFDFDVGDSLAIRTVRIYPEFDNPGIGIALTW